VNVYHVYLSQKPFYRHDRHSIPTIHKVLFGASTAMFLISVVHLGLVMRQVSVDVNPLSNFQAQVVLATTQVRPDQWQGYPTFVVIDYSCSLSLEI
jgi:hypothetical protein